MRYLTLSFLLVGLGACGGIPPIEPPEPPEPTPPPWECELQMPGCHETGQTCSTEEQPCWHNPTQNPEHCEEAPACPPPVEPPDPPEPPPGGECKRFPQGLPDDAFAGIPNPGNFGSIVNREMARLTGCAVGGDCPITFHPDIWMSMVCEALCGQGFLCGRHDDTPPGASDQISVGLSEKWCDGSGHENYQIYNYGGAKVRWAPGGKQDGWTCAIACPVPHPDMTRMKFNAAEKGSHLDTTLTTVGQPEFCASIGYCCMPGTGDPPNTCGSPGCIPRGGCPLRGDGNPLRPVCEAQLCDQRWECNGEPVEGWRGNPAQTDCRGEYRTWCEKSPTVVLEGRR